MNRRKGKANIIERRKIKTVHAVTDEMQKRRYTNS